MKSLRRGYITRFISVHQRAWDVVMSAAAVAYVALAIRGDVTPGSVPELLDWSFSAVFITEFVVRFLDASSRRSYVRSHWLDLVSCIPMIGFLRAFRLLRLLKLAATVRVLGVMDKELVHKGHSRNSMWFLTPCVLLLWVCCAYAAWFFEHGTNPHMSSFGDALYWSFITATTVGYGDLTPITVGGRLVSGVNAFVGIGLLTVTSARLTAIWLRQEDANDPVLRHLDYLNSEVAALRELLTTSRG